MTSRVKLWHSVQLGLPAVSRRIRRLSYIRKRIRPTKNYCRLLLIFLFLVICVLFVVRRLGVLQSFIAYVLSGGDLLPATYIYGNGPDIDGRSFDGSGEGSLHLWRRIGRDFPAEKSVPDPNIYGTGGEVCYALGRPDAIRGPVHSGDPASVWQMNSRAFCVNIKPSCLYGNRLENILTFERRGSSACKVISVSNSNVEDMRQKGLNESCAAFRKRHVTSLYGSEMFSPYDKWYESVTEKFKTGTNEHSPILWASQFAIVVPKYQWSYNICHYFRIWSYILWIVRNLRLYVHDANRITHIHVFYRAGYKYKLFWHTGMRDAAIAAIRRELGITLTVGRLRFNPDVGFQCLHRSIWLGREGRVDAFPYFNDSSVWFPKYQKNDSHWPVIPHDSLWLRQIVSTWAGLPPVGSFRGDIPSHFDTIPVPPKRVGVLLRSPKSRRRFTTNGDAWFQATLHELGTKHGLEIQKVRTSANMRFRDQVAIMRRIGLAVGIHGANFVNSIFMPAAGALFEIFPYRYVRYYYAAGGNSGLRYSFHEAEGGVDKKCEFPGLKCVVKYREAVIYLTKTDRQWIRKRLDNAMAYLVRLHEMYPEGYISLRRDGNTYHFGEQ